MKRVIGATTAAGCAALLIAGCGITHPSSGGAAGAPGSSGSATVASATPRNRAAADATSILSSFVPPPGAAKLTAAPSAGNGILRRPATVPGSPNVVDDVSWWRVPGTPQAVLAWEKAHLPSRFAPAGSGQSGAPAALWSDRYSLPPVTGVLAQRDLAVQAVNAGGGQTAVRIDARVTWLPAKPASERVPAAAKVVTISATPGPVVGAKVPSPVTITNAATVRRIASLVNGPPPFPPGKYSCPVELGRAVQMTFRATPDGAPLAVVTADLTGCRGVRFVAGGKPQPALTGGPDVARAVLAAAGLHWTGYSPAPTPPAGVNPGGVMRPR